MLNQSRRLTADWSSMLDQLGYLTTGWRSMLDQSGYRAVYSDRSSPNRNFDLQYALRRSATMRLPGMWPRVTCRENGGWSVLDFARRVRALEQRVRFRTIHVARIRVNVRVNGNNRAHLRASDGGRRLLSWARERQCKWSDELDVSRWKLLQPRSCSSIAPKCRSTSRSGYPTPGKHRAPSAPRLPSAIIDRRVDRGCQVPHAPQ